MKTFITILIIILAAIGAYWYWGNNGNVEPVEVENEEQPVATMPELTTTYITAVDWPPALSAVEGEYSCTEAGEETARAGKTERRIINGQEYCRTVVTEGAAGSIYSQYAYVFERDGETFSMTFSTRAPQCGNYDEAQRLECEAELNSFDVDEIADQAAKALAM